MRVATIVTGNPERQRLASAEYPGARLLGAPEDVFSSRDAFDLVVISTPNRTHVPLATQAIDAGLAVVVDKPVATSASAARELAERARRRGVFLSVYQNRRWDGDFLTIRRLIAEKALGNVHRFESRFERWRPATKGGWRELGDPEEGGGLLFDLGTHLVDQALVLFGPVSDVYAEVDRRRPGAAVDDDVFLALTHASGVRSHLWTSMLTAQEGPRFRVLGDHGTYTKFGTDVQEEALRGGQRPDAPDWGREPAEQYGILGTGSATRPVPTERGDYRQFYQGVARALRQGGRPPVEPADAVAVLEIIERAGRLARK